MQAPFKGGRMSLTLWMNRQYANQVKDPDCMKLERSVSAATHCNTLPLFGLKFILRWVVPKFSLCVLHSWLRDAAEDALEAHRHGAAGVIVSNHGGRQLDGTPATIDVLAEIVAAVGDKLEVYLDSGVRTGADVVKALALGARAVFVGRPVLWGLAYNGKQGVERVLQILRNELEHTMRLLGCSDVTDLCEDFVIQEKRYSRPLRCAL
ncbi:2-Hydroxyacid oxidase 2-like [Dermacentor silvarum]|uniref:2-Hydroxyacid oxidase 2-like n=1 Tax=Dermacentor silvarum TaxID=543639 RepID=UPI002100FA1A|nr:2-Hydroxyacid oxidase 2-like [Dermacentor silvarum]